MDFYEDDSSNISLDEYYGENFLNCDLVDTELGESSIAKSIYSGDYDSISEDIKISAYESHLPREYDSPGVSGSLAYNPNGLGVSLDKDYAGPPGDSRFTPFVSIVSEFDGKKLDFIPKAGIIIKFDPP